MSRKVGIILTAIVAAIVGLWLWAGIIPKGSTSIGGSTSVDPVMQRLTNTYHKHYKGDSFIYSSSGSTGGVNNAKSGTYKIGFISRALDDSADYVNTKFTTDITNVKDDNYTKLGDQIYTYLTTNDYSGNQMHYVQVATDAIILTYDAPDWFKDNFSKYFDIKFDEKGNVLPEWQTLIQNIYHGKYTWRKVATDINKINSKADLSKIQDDNADDVITPFARETGSGTRSAFDSAFKLGSNNKDDPTSPSRATEYNSNGMMYNNFRMNTFGYMSLNYLGQIQGSNSLETVSVNDIDPHSQKDFINLVDTNKTDETMYTLTRPYIGLIKWNLNDKEMKKISNFLAWMATAIGEQKSGQKEANNDDAYSQYLKAGLKPEFKLDDSNIPGAPTTTKAPKVETINQTSLNLRRTINQGYLPRH